MSSIIKVNTFQDANGNALFSSDGSGNVTMSANGVKNTPAFLATNGSTDQLIANDTAVKITLGTEVIDTDNAFADSRFTVPSGKGGKYLISAGIDFFSGSNNMTANNLKIYKNGSQFYSHTYNGNGNANLRRNSPTTTLVMDLSAGDYIELYGVTNRADGLGTNVKAPEGATFFQGYKIIGA